MEGSFRARTCRQTYLVFACMAAPLLLLFACVAIRDGSLTSNAGSVVAMILLVLGFAFVWLRTYRITIEDGRLQYRSLWCGRQSVRLSDLQSVKIESGHSRYRDRFKPAVRLMVRYTESGKDRSLCINLKVFSRSDAKKVCSLLKA
jgi:hypothetical protein